MTKQELKATLEKAKVMASDDVANGEIDKKQFGERAAYYFRWMIQQGDRSTKPREWNSFIHE